MALFAAQNSRISVDRTGPDDSIAADSRDPLLDRPDLFDGARSLKIRLLTT